MCLSDLIFIILIPLCVNLASIDKIVCGVGGLYWLCSERLVRVRLCGAQSGLSVATQCLCPRSGLTHPTVKHVSASHHHLPPSPGCHLPPSHGSPACQQIFLRCQLPPPARPGVSRRHRQQGRLRALQGGETLWKYFNSIILPKIFLSNKLI